MKIASPILLISTTIGVANAVSRPTISVQVRDGSFGGLDDIDPSITWEGATTYEGYDVKYGAEASLRVKKDVASLPRCVWGKVSRTVQSWGVSMKAEVYSEDVKNAKVEIVADNPKEDLCFKFNGLAGDHLSLSRAELTKGIQIDGSHSISITPRINLNTKETDILLNYDKDKTEIDLLASKKSQSIKISHQIDAKNRIAPTFATGGKFSLEYEYLLENGNTVTTKLTPNEKIDVIWKDGKWNVYIDMPLDGTSITTASVNIKRDVEI